MQHSSILFKYILIVLFPFQIQCQGCPLIETVSFGSDIQIKCNETYLMFMENNSEGARWMFYDPSNTCREQKILEAPVNKCRVQKIANKYLGVELQINKYNRPEYACLYCSINYKLIAPLIQVTQTSYSYIFHINATGLNVNEQFEIIWAKRIHTEHRHSISYWFYRDCYHQDIIEFERIEHSIRFVVKDTSIKRVEFIIRRCHKYCLQIKKCTDERIGVLSNENYFTKPDALEKIVCDEDCLAGILPSTTTTIPSKEILLLSTIQLSHEKQTMRYLILFPLLVLLIVLLFSFLVCFIILKRKNSRSANTYTKTSNIDLDEYKQTNQQSK